MRKTVDFSKFTDEQLWEIYKSTNVFEWNDLLGEKPEGFDNLSKCRFGFLHRIFYRRVKEDYTSPIRRLVQDLMPWDFFEKKEEEYHKEQVDILHEHFKKSILTEKNLKARLGKELFEHMSRQ